MTSSSGDVITTNISGVLCEVRSSMQDTPYPMAFFGYLWGASILCFITLSIFYILIGKVILERRKKKKQRKKEKEIRRQSSRRATAGGGGGDDGDVERNNFLMPPAPSGVSKNGGGGGAASPKRRLDTLVVSEDGCTQTETSVMSGTTATVMSEPASGDSACGNGRCGSFSGSVRIKRPPKSTLMLFAISAVYLFSFIPFLMVAIVRQVVGPSFYPSLSPAAQVAVSIAGKSYLVNNVANPIVYGMCNSQFREEVRQLLRLPKTSKCPSLSSRDEANIDLRT